MLSKKTNLQIVAMARKDAEVLIKYSEGAEFLKLHIKKYSSLLTNLPKYILFNRTVASILEEALIKTEKSNQCNSPV